MYFSPYLSVYVACLSSIFRTILSGNCLSTFASSTYGLCFILFIVLLLFIKNMFSPLFMFDSSIISDLLILLFPVTSIVLILNNGDNNIASMVPNYDCCYCYSF